MNGCYLIIIISLLCIVKGTSFQTRKRGTSSSKVWAAEREKIIRFIQMYSNKQRDRIIDCLPEARKKNTHRW
ncbi:TPA: hypothetical protein ACGOST_001798, partial [Streptococcus suis]